MTDTAKAPSGWKRPTIGACASVKRGASPRPIDAPKWWGGDIGWVRISDVTSSRKYLTRTRDYLSKEGVSNSVKMDVGEVILSICATIGRPIITTVPVCIHDGFVWFDGLDDSIDREYFYYFLSSKEAELSRSRQTGTQGNLNTTIVSKLEFPHPASKSEQRKIAEILAAIDTAIDQTDALISKRQRLNAGLMRDLLARGVDRHGNVRTEFTHPLKESPAGRIPVEWDPSTLERVGTWHSGGTPSKSNSDYWGEQVPWLCPKDMKSFDVATTTDRLTPAGALHGSKEVPADAVFIVVRGMILAHTFPVSISSVPMAFNQDVKAIVVGQDVVPRFLAFWLRSNGHQLLKLTTTATHGTKRFDMRELFDIPIALPEKEEQAEIVKRLDSAAEYITANIKAAAKLRSLKIGLMQKLLTGSKRVTALLEESNQELAQVS